MDQYQLINSHSYNAVIKDVNKKKHNYFLLLFLKAYNIINYPNSKWVITNVMQSEIKKELQFQSYKEYSQYNLKDDSYENSRITDLMYISEIALQKEHDIFRLPSGAIICSEKLKNEIKSSDLTGIVLEEYKRSFFVI